jgi:AraC family transcriptional regulator
LDDCYVVEMVTSRSPFQVEQKYDRWRLGRWRRGDLSIYPHEDTDWRWHGTAGTTVFFLPIQSWLRMADEAFGCTDSTIAPTPCFGLKDEALKQILLLLSDELHAGGVGGSLYADGLIHAVLARLLQRHSTHRLTPLSVSTGLSSAQLRQVDEFIEAHLADAISVDDLAAAANVDRFYLRRVFRATTGTTPYKYVLQRRIDRAVRLLGSPSLGLAEIAFSTGFSSQSHFTTVFRHTKGVTPKVYRGTLS